MTYQDDLTLPTELLEQMAFFAYTYFAATEAIADELNPLTISHTLREISNKPPGRERRTPTGYPKSSKIVPDTNTM